jgi:lysozyme
MLMLSPDGAKAIKFYEGLRLNPYKDGAGHWTIGYGHLIKPNEDHLMDGISKETAEALFIKDTKDKLKCVEESVRVELTQGQLDALVSFVFNLGCYAFKSSTLLKKLNKGDYAGAAEEFKKWVLVSGKRSKGLVLRRELERKMFLGL